ncbi:hypothetical protein HYS47_00415 [Candidatus Woesearchaeota archaeon]|nr:hypothetical protein [Candidatus Woesearchaeota archaeon]
MTVTVHYRLPDHSTLHAYALDDLTEDDLTALIEQQQRPDSQRDGESGASIHALLRHLAEQKPVKAVVNFLDDIVVVPDEREYEIPAAFQPFRQALETQLRERGMFNGPIMVVRGDVVLPLRLCKGGFFDYKATELTAVPADILPDKYPAGRTVKELLHDYSLFDYGLSPDHLARYLGITFVMLTRDGTEVGLVQRAKHLGVAPDCIALSGATPPFTENLFEPGFDFPGYLKKCVAGEMKDEYHFEPEEFGIGRCYLIDDRMAMPVIAMEIITPLSTEELAARCKGDEKVIREHPVLYAASVNAIPSLISVMKLHDGTARILDIVYRDHVSLGIE